MSAVAPSAEVVRSEAGASLRVRFGELPQWIHLCSFGGKPILSAPLFVAFKQKVSIDSTKKILVQREFLAFFACHTIEHRAKL